MIEITSEIFLMKDDLVEGDDLVDTILDKAKSKGTGKWTSQNAMDLGIPIPTIDVAVSMRAVSAFKDQRVKAEKLYPKPNFSEDTPTVDQIGDALLICLYYYLCTGYESIGELHHGI